MLRALDISCYTSTSSLAAHHARYSFDRAVLLRGCLRPVVSRGLICRDGVSNCKGGLAGQHRPFRVEVVGSQGTLT